MNLFMKASPPPALSLLTLLPLLPLLALATGCVGANGAVTSDPITPSKPAVVFPSRAELAKLPSEPPRAEVFGTTEVPADEWAVEEPPAPSVPYDDPSPIGVFLQDVQRPHGASVTLSAPLRCAAKELGRFFLEHHGLPNDSLRRFVVARCGSEAPAVAPVAWTIAAPAAIPDAQVIARGRPDLERALERDLEQGEHEVGMALVRDKGNAAIVAVVAPKSVALEPGLRAVGENRKITLRGVARRDVGVVLAFANHGDFAVSRCDGNPSVALPKFELTCELAAGDPWAWVEIVGQKKGEALQQPLADLIVYEQGRDVVYKARSFGAPAPVHTAADFTSALLDRLNGVRRLAKLAPLTLAPKQSDENARLVGTIFDAGVKGDSATVDRAAIGLLAGWNVEGGTIRNGYFFLGAVAPTHDAIDWLDAAIERPVGRTALLEPTVRQIAIGPAIPGDAPALGAAVTTYALFAPESDHAAEEKQFLQALAAARRARGLTPPARVGGLEETRAEAAKVLLGAKVPMQALKDLIQVAVARTGSTVRGYVFETTDPALVAFPPELLRAGPLDVVVTVTHHRAPDAAWGQYVIFVLVLDDSKTIEA